MVIAKILLLVAIYSTNMLNVKPFMRVVWSSRLLVFLR